MKGERVRSECEGMQSRGGLCEEAVRGLWRLLGLRLGDMGCTKPGDLWLRCVRVLEGCVRRD